MGSLSCGCRIRLDGSFESLCDFHERAQQQEAQNTALAEIEDLRACLERAERERDEFRAELERLLAEGRIIAKDLHEQLRPMFEVTPEQMNRRLR